MTGTFMKQRCPPPTKLICMGGNKCVQERSDPRNVCGRRVLYWLRGSKPNCTSITSTVVSVSIMIKYGKAIKSYF